MFDIDSNLTSDFRIESVSHIFRRLCAHIVGIAHAVRVKRVRET